MGKRIVIEDAVFQDFIFDFDYKSDNIGDINIDDITNSLKVENKGDTGDYNWAATSDVNSVKITMPVNSAVANNAFVIGVNSNGDALVLYIGLEQGAIKIFEKTGVPSVTLVYTIPNFTNAPKGTEITFTKITGGVNVSFTGYSVNILNINIPGFDNTVFGVLATGSSICEYTFKLN